MVNHSLLLVAGLLSSVGSANPINAVIVERATTVTPLSVSSSTRTSSNSALTSTTGAVATPTALTVAGLPLLNGLGGALGSLPQIYSSLVSNLTQATPTTKPANIAQALSTVNSIFAAQPTAFLQNAISLVQNSFTLGDLNQVALTYSAGCNSEFNVNTRSPSGTIYPKKASSDAPYSLTEAQLRRVIYIPSTFTYGQKPPVVLVPGTGSKGCLTYGSNFIKLFNGVSYADPVWLNIPDFLLDDAQVNAEYVAYAINYISGISGNKNVSVIAWSQGNLDTQWAFKYWPSTTKVTNNLISISPDFHGTILAYLPCGSGVPGQPCTPGVIQQDYNSVFVNTLRRNGGDSAYVPTTTIYSATDEIVQPQVGGAASAIIGDARGVGVSNSQVQTVCAGKPAGTAYTHEGILYHPLAFALAVDALKNKGPGQVSRLSNLNTICSQLATSGLSLSDVLATEGNIPIAGAAIGLYQPKVIYEPPIKAYATY